MRRLDTGEVEVEIRGEVLRMTPERALYWPRTRTLFVADLHLGKAATFRASGIPLPEGGNAADLERLGQAVARTGADKLIVLGDMIHARRGRDGGGAGAFAAWRAAHRDLDVILVRGNHDRHAGDPPGAWDVRVVDGPTPGPLFVLQHEPEPPDDSEAYALAGHVHPAARLRGRGGQRVKLPCFWLQERVAVLPAFSLFTGGASVRPAVGDRVFAVAGARVMDVTATMR